MEALNTIIGKTHTDHRGTLSFWNDFDMSPIKRFYTIFHTNTLVNRGWRGHKIEQRWFHVTIGSFLIRVVEIDNWESPSKQLPVKEYILSADKLEILHVPAGNATMISALTENSKLMVFADFGLEHSVFDDYLYKEDYF